MGLGFRSLAFCCIALGAVRPCFSQDTPAVESSAGYQYLNWEEDPEDEFSLTRGWYADVAFNRNRVIGIIGQISGGYKRMTSHVSNGGFTVDVDGDLNLHQFMTGLRLSDRSRSRAVWFGQLLLGGVRTAGSVTVVGTGTGIPTIAETIGGSKTHFGLQAGGGLSLRLTNAVGVRLGADLLRVFSEGEGRNLFRFASGIVLPFGRT